MDLQFSWEQNEFRRQVARFADERIAPVADELDAGGAPPRALIREMGELGFLGVKFPEEYGGAGIAEPHTCHCLLVEELSRANAGFASTIAMGTSVPPSAIFHLGSEDLKQRYLVPTLTGEKVGAFGLTEPEAGSDAAAIRTRAVRDGDAYVLTGTKIFTTNGTVADYVVAAAKTDPEKGLKGTSLFVVDTASEGFRVGKKLSKFTTHCSDTAEIVLDGVVVPRENLLGEENTGLLSVMTLLEEDRIMTAAISLGIAKSAYAAALRYAQERKQFGKTIASFQAVRFRLAEMATLLETAELYTYYAARKADRGERVAKEAAMAKIIVCEGANRLCQMALSIFGGYGLMTEFPAERYLRDSYFPLVGGGTPDIMRVVVARELGL